MNALSKRQIKRIQEYRANMLLDAPPEVMPIFRVLGAMRALQLIKTRTFFGVANRAKVATLVIKFIEEP